MYILGEMPARIGYNDALKAFDIDAHFAFALGKVVFHRA
jgi:hypothetical protein